MPPPAPGPKPPTSTHWEEASTEFTQRCAFVAIWGPESAGKTTLALTAPGPHALLHSAEKINGITQPFVRKGAKIRIHNFGFAASKNEAETAERARPVWAALESHYNDAMDKWAKTIDLDTEPDAWALRRFARFGTLNPQGELRSLYTPVNFDWQQMLKAKFRAQVYGRKCNLITIHTAKDIYKDVLNPKTGKKVSERTGQQKLEGQKGIPYWADVILFVYRDILGDGGYHVRIDKGWFNGAVEGMDLTSDIMAALEYTQHPVTGSHLHFASIMALITETQEAEWAKP